MPVVAAIAPMVLKAGAGAIAGKILGGGKAGPGAANERGDKLSKEAVQSAKNLQKTAADMNGRADDRWNFYKEHGENVDIMLIDDAVQMFKETFAGGSERAAARAAEDVASAFDRSAEVRRRASFRFGGVDPTSGKFQGLERESEVARARTEAASRFSARRTEEDRARALLNNASNIANRAIDQSQRFSSLGITSESSAAEIFAGQVGDARADAAGSAKLIGDVAGKIPFDDIFDAFGNKKGDDSSSGVSESGDFVGAPEEPPVRRVVTQTNLKAGGKIKGYKRGGVIPGDGRRGGKLNGPGSGRSDSIKATVDGTGQDVRLSAGEFIIPAHIVKQKGDNFFNQLIRG